MGYHSCYILVILLYIAMIVYSESTKQHPSSTNHARPLADFSLHLPMSQLKDGRDKREQMYLRHRSSRDTLTLLQDLTLTAKWEAVHIPFSNVLAIRTGLHDRPCPFTSLRKLAAWVCRIIADYDITQSS